MTTTQRERSVRYKTLDASIQEVTGRHIEFIASQEVQDRDGDIIEVSGIDTRDFMRNALFLGDHDKQFILGKVTKLWKARLPDAPALLGKAELLPAGVSARADQRYAEIKFGAAKGISIGFIPRTREPIPTGYRYPQIDLMEVSSVSIPSCPTCVITSKSAPQRLRSTAPHHKETTMYADIDEDEKYLELSDDFYRKAAEDDFAAMCARMRQAYEEFGSDKFIQLMAAQIIANPETCAAVTQALQSAGVYAPKHWKSDNELFEIDERELAVAIAQVIATETGTQVRAALNAAVGRLD